MLFFTGASAVSRSYRGLRGRRLRRCSRAQMDAVLRSMLDSLRSSWTKLALCYCQQHLFLRDAKGVSRFLFSIPGWIFLEFRFVFFPPRDGFFTLIFFLSYRLVKVLLLRLLDVVLSTLTMEGGGLVSPPP